MKAVLNGREVRDKKTLNCVNPITKFHSQTLPLPTQLKKNINTSHLVTQSPFYAGDIACLKLENT